MTRTAEIQARLDAIRAKDRPDCGPFRATPEGGTDPYDHELAHIWGPDGDQLGTAFGNLALGIDGDALAEMWAHANTDLAWLLEEVERLRAELASESGIEARYAEILRYRDFERQARDAEWRAARNPTP